MGKCQKIGTIIGGILALVVMVAIRSRGHMFGIKLFGVLFIIIGAYIGKYFDKRTGHNTD